MFYRDSRRALLIAAFFDDAEQKRFLSFLASPYCTDMPPENDCLRLMELFFNQLNQVDKKGLITDKVLFEALYAPRAFSAEAFNELTAEAFRLLRKFIVMELGANNHLEWSEPLYLMHFYKNKGVVDKFWDTKKTLSRKQNDDNPWDLDDYRWSFLVEKEEVEFASLYNRKKDDLNLLKAIKALTNYFLVESMVLAIVLFGQKQTASLALPPLRQILPYDLQNPHLDWFFSSTLGRLFVLSLQFMEADTGLPAAEYREFESLLVEAEGKIHPDFLNNFELIGINYLTAQCNSGNYQFRMPLFNAFKHRIDQKRIYYDGKILAAELQAIVTLGLRLGELEWTYQFLQKHRDIITGDENPEGVYGFNLANCLFHFKQYDEALLTLHDVLKSSNFAEMQYRTSAKLLEIKILYEIDHPDLDTVVEAAKQYFHRMKNQAHNPAKKSTTERDLPVDDTTPRPKRGRKKKQDKPENGPASEAQFKQNAVMAVRYEHYVKFINMMKQVIRIKHDADPKRVDTLLQKLEKNKLFADFDWLREKLTTLRK